MRLFYLFLLVALFAGKQLANAQTGDSLRKAMHGAIVPSFSFDSRNSFISSRRANIWGVKAGAEFGGKITLGLGWNKLNDDLIKTIYYNRVDGRLDSAEGALQFQYLSAHIQYVFFQDKRWKYSVTPFHLGIGNSFYRYTADDGQRKQGQRMMLLYEWGISTSYKVLPWLGFGLDLGLRLALLRNKAIPENFNSPMYSVYMIVYWAEIFKTAFPESKWAKRI
ncbi:MAG: hypothetical protein ACRCYO_15045 [Bacteroidia bacterium]